MRPLLPAPKASRNAVYSSVREVATTPNGIAIAPPDYGIEVVDRVSAEVGSEYSKAYRSPILFAPPPGGVIQKRATASGLAREPRSLRETIDPGTMSNEELEAKIAALRQLWFVSTSSTQETNDVIEVLQRLENEVSTRRGAFSPEFASAYETAHAEVYPEEGPFCMDAVYNGLGILFSESEASEIKSETEDENMIAIMENLRQSGKAGSKIKLVYSASTDRWVPDPEQTILNLTSPTFRGWYFFGLALHRAYHSVTLVVDKMDPGNPRIYWMDQYVKGFGETSTWTERTNDVTGRLQVEMKEFEPDYGYQWSEIWQILPDSQSLEAPALQSCE